MHILIRQCELRWVPEEAVLSFQAAPSMVAAAATPSPAGGTGSGPLRGLTIAGVGVSKAGAYTRPLLSST